MLADQGVAMHLNDALERADRDIATAREYIEHQKTLIKDLEGYGRDTTRAVKLLDVFQESRKAMLGYRALIVEQIEHLSSK
jgi:hypothetical protein